MVKPSKCIFDSKCNKYPDTFVIHNNLIYLLWVIDNTCDFLGVSLKDADNLSRVFVEHRYVLIITSSDNLSRVSKANIKGQDSRNTCAVQTLQKL